MYHIVYLTTNIINNKFYVGVHSTYNLEDGYLGTGKTIIKAIKKYGKQNFKRQILHYCLTKEDAYSLEKQIVDYHFIQRNDTYNLNYGGIGCLFVNISDETKTKMSLSHIGKPSGRKGIPMSDEHKQKVKDFMTTNNPFKGKTHSEEFKTKLSECRKGTNNPNYGRKHSEETLQKMRDKRKLQIMKKAD